MRFIIFISILFVMLWAQAAMSSSVVCASYLVYKAVETVTEINAVANEKVAFQIRKHKMKCVWSGKEYKCYHLPERLK